MYNEMINNLKANEVGEEKACEIINKAAMKANKVGKQLVDKYHMEDEIDLTYNEGLTTIMVNLMMQLLNICEIIEDLTDMTVIGAERYLTNELGIETEAIFDMTEDELGEYIEPYQRVQHTFADFNNKEIREMLFEVAKQILTPEEILELL